MDESQASCRDLYQCSCPELDALVAVNKGAGAIGSRLTGAGWGGCTVSLVREGDVAGFIEKVCVCVWVGETPGGGGRILLLLLWRMPSFRACPVSDWGPIAAPLTLSPPPTHTRAPHPRR